MISHLNLIVNSIHMKCLYHKERKTLPEFDFLQIYNILTFKSVQLHRRVQYEQNHHHKNTTMVQWKKQTLSSERRVAISS